MIGHSLGGLETLWLTWYDTRITAAVSSCGFGLLRTLVRDGINHGFAMYVPGILEVCDLDELVATLAPRPFLLTAGETDPIFPIDGVRSLVAKAQHHYTQEGVPAQFQAIVFPAGHSFPDDVKREAYDFLDRSLLRGSLIQIRMLVYNLSSLYVAPEASSTAELSFWWLIVYGYMKHCPSPR